MQKVLFFLLFGGVVSLPIAAQAPPELLVTQPVNESKLIHLKTTVHPLAQARYDHGIVNESTPAERLLLILNRPPKREAAFRQLLKDLHTPGSPDYHHWLTPQEIGSRFGPADADLDAVAGWLGNSGFRVSRVSNARRFVEFSGNVGQVNAAFHTQIHEYLVDGVLHHANATEVQIPQALAGIVAALSPLHDFRPTSQVQQGVRAHYDAPARQFVPEFNLPSNSAPLLYGVAPADFYTQYDLNPLYSASVNGTGVTIGIIDESNIDVSLANAYRSVFGVKPNSVQVVLDGGDPGFNSSQTESYLDVELAGAVAPGATVNLYISAGSPFQDPLTLAAVRAIDDNQADVLSLSWGEGEEELGTSGNQFWNALWEQAAAQGQTVLVSAGDYGQVPDDDYLTQGSLPGPAVSGLATTPWNIAVGGTDFYYADYARGAPSAHTFWSAANDPVTKGSLKAPITEQVWSDGFGLDAIANGYEFGEIYAGGGGASNCSTVNLVTGGCISGYAKPPWQTGPGVPPDGVRDIPDVSLFASNGVNYSGYVTCDSEGDCVPDANGNFTFDVLGGTSASVQAMAGIMALVDQKYGRQGQANTVLYPLAQQKPAAFHDITLGGNQSICIEGDADCTLGIAGVQANQGESTVYAATTGFDLASGLGTVDAANLVTNWNAITFKSTTTSLQLSPATITHGLSVALTSTVTPASGSGTPTGTVAILTTSSLPSSESQTAIPLNAGAASATLNNLPGGTYEVTAQYGGDGVFAASTSSPQTLTVSPEQSTLVLKLLGQNDAPASYLTYGLPVYLSAQPVGVNLLAGQSNGAATGSIAFTLDGAATAIPLNASGIASWTAPSLAVGTHTAGAAYSGDASFQASSAPTVNFSVNKGYPSLGVNVLAPLSNSIGGWAVNPGGSISVAVKVGPPVGVLNGQIAPIGLIGPTGTVTICLSTTDLVFPSCINPAYQQTVSLVSPNGIYSQYSQATVTFTSLSPGEYFPEVTYNGDSNWGGSNENLLNFILVQATTPETASTTTLSISPASISGNQEATLTATVTGSNGVAPTGYVYCYDGGTSIGTAYLTPSANGATSTGTLQVSPAGFWNNGPNPIVALYVGDNHYAGSTSNAVSISVNQTVGDFAIVPAVPQITVAGGSSGTVALNLTSVNQFNATLNLTCTPSSSKITCSVNPASPALNGVASATLTINAAASSATAKLPPPARKIRALFSAGTALAFCFLLVLPSRRRRWMRMTLLPIILVSFFMVSCGGGAVSSSGSGGSGSGGTGGSGGGGTGGGGTGGGGTGGGGSTTDPTPAYTVLVSGTANGVVHNAVVYVVVK